MTLTLTRPLLTRLLNCARRSELLESALLPPGKSYFHKAELRTSATRLIPSKINVNNTILNIKKVGNGCHPILCLPGAFGSVESEVPPYLKSLSLENFTIVAWDPPGYGHSRPPNRDVLADPRRVLSNDADLAHGVMIALGFKRYSLLGWNDGALTAIYLANSYPKSVRKIVLLDVKAFLSKDDREDYIKTRNIDNLPDKIKAPMVDIYGEKYLRQAWADWSDGFIEIYEKDGELCKNLLYTITCPTLIIQGIDDEGAKIILKKQHAEYLRQYIKDSKVLALGNCRQTSELTASLQEFLLESDLKENEPIIVFNSLCE